MRFHRLLTHFITITVVFVAAIAPAHGAGKPGPVQSLVATCKRLYGEIAAKRWSNAVGPSPSTFFAKTESGLRVDPAVREKIQGLREALMIESASQNYYGHPVCLTQNHCHGASMYLRTVLKEKLQMRAKLVTFEPRSGTEGGFEHSFLIIPDYFGPQSPLVIDPTIKQFMPHKKWNLMHDIFVGSPEEYLLFMREHNVHRGLESSDQSFQYFMRAEDTGRFPETP